jgi:hypothetical protein
MGRASSSIDLIRKRIAKTHELIGGSYHEAGHTVYALLHLMKVNHTYIFENEESGRIHGGSNYCDPMVFEEVQDQELLNIMVKADVGMSYAGLISEKVLFQQMSGSSKIPMFISEGSYDDNRSARQVIARYNLAPPGQKRATFKRKLMIEVQHKLHVYWNDVMLISHALFKKRKLMFVDLARLLTNKSINKGFWKEQFKKIRRIHDRQIAEQELKSLLK